MIGWWGSGDVDLVEGGRVRRPLAEQRRGRRGGGDGGPDHRARPAAPARDLGRHARDAALGAGERRRRDGAPLHLHGRAPGGVRDAQHRGLAHAPRRRWRRSSTAARSTWSTSSPSGSPSTRPTWPRADGDWRISQNSPSLSASRGSTAVRRRAPARGAPRPRARRRALADPRPLARLGRARPRSPRAGRRPATVHRAAASAAIAASSRPASARKREYMSRKLPPPVPRRSITW